MADVKNILVIEDDALIAMAVADDLEGIGSPTTVATADDALAALATGRFHFAVVDYHLRGGTSHAVIAALQDRGVPFVICTGSSPAADGAFDGMVQLSKPYLINDLRRVVLAGLESTTGAEAHHSLAPVQGKGTPQDCGVPEQEGSPPPCRVE